MTIAAWTDTRLTENHIMNTQCFNCHATIMPSDIRAWERGFADHHCTPEPGDICDICENCEAERQECAEWCDYCDEDFAPV